jgi:PAS domain S-box-containing protein
MRFNETEYTSPGQMDFVPRERRNQIWNIIGAFSITIALIIALTLMPQTVGGHSISALVSIIMVALLCFYVIYRKQQNLDLVMATEYQNMLFAQAVSLGANFTLFVRRDGTIVYSNGGIYEVFPQLKHSEASALEGVFEQGGVPKPDRDRIMSAIYSSSNDRLVFPIRTETGEEKEYVLTVEPLVRPGGFAVIRGREYRGQRAGVQLMPDVLRTTSADKLDHLLASSPIGLYVTDQFGRFEYVNPAMEQLFGYAGGELLESRISIHHLLYQLNGQPVPDDYLIADYNGEALFQKKQGSLVNALLKQSLVRDNGGKVLGASGTILPHSGKTA